MKYWEREKMILQMLQETESVSLTAVCNATGASVATVRRDFEEIQKKGLAERTHGGLRLPQKKEEPHPYVSGTVVSDPSDEERLVIAREAAALVSSGDSIFIGAGKTCNMFAAALRGMDRLTVVTTSITAVLELVDCPGISVTLLGGDVRSGRDYIETLDASIYQALRGYFFDKVFLTAEGMDLERGYTVQDKNRSGLYSQLARMTRRLYMLLDSGKFGHRAFASVFPADKTCRVITTKNLPTAYAEFFAKHGIVATQVPIE